MATTGWLGSISLVSGGFGHEEMKGDVRIDSIIRNGDNITVNGVYGVYADGPAGYSYYYVYPINAKVNNLGYSQVVAGRQSIYVGHDPVTVGFSTTMNVGASATSATFTVDWLYNNGTASNSQSYTIYFDPGYIAPNTPSVSVSNIKYNKMDVTYGTSSFGNPASGTVKLYFNGTEKASKTSTGNTTVTVTGLTKGTTYTITATANNGHLSATGSTSATTKPTAYEKTLVSVGGVSKKALKAYCSVNGSSKKVLKVYMSENGQTKLAFEET